LLDKNPQNQTENGKMKRGSIGDKYLGIIADFYSFS
jgi:hypothetical protein